MIMENCLKDLQKESYNHTFWEGAATLVILFLVLVQCLIKIAM